jgi:hypothetical protein
MTDAIRYPIAYHTTTPYQMRDFNMKGGNWLWEVQHL